MTDRPSYGPFVTVTVRKRALELVLERAQFTDDEKADIYRTESNDAIFGALDRVEKALEEAEVFRIDVPMMCMNCEDVHLVSVSASESKLAFAPCPECGVSTQHRPEWWVRANDTEE